MEDFLDKDQNSAISDQEDFETSSLMNGSPQSFRKRSASPKPKKSVRELSVQNMKLTEELVQQNLDQTSNIEKISEDKSKLLVQLHQQKLKNKKLNDENIILANHLSQLMESKSNSLTDQKSDRKALSTPRDSATNREPLPRKLIEYADYDACHRSQPVSNLVSPIHSFNLMTPNQESTRNLFQNMNMQPQFQVFNQGANYSANDIVLLQNHIALVEKENNLLKKEISLSKQQEPYWSFKVKELELELKMVAESQKRVAQENADLKEVSQNRISESNQKILQLTQINQEMAMKIKNYQKVVEKLTNEIYVYAYNQNHQNQNQNQLQSQPVSHQGSKMEIKIPSVRSSLNSLSDMNNMNSLTERNQRFSVDKPDDVMNLRQENFKLKADFKALNERSEILSRENSHMKTILTKKIPLSVSQSENMPIEIIQDNRRYSVAAGDDGSKQRQELPRGSHKPSEKKVTIVNSSESRLREMIASVDAKNYMRSSSEKKLGIKK